MSLPQLIESESPEKLSQDYGNNISTTVDTALCASDPKRFLREHAWIQTRARPPKTVKWQPWDYLLDLLDILQTYDDVVILKARQLGITWLVCGYCLWMTLFNESSKTLYFSQGEKEAWALVGKSRFIWSHLPEHLRKPIATNDHDTRGWLEWVDTSSGLNALPSTARAGRSEDTTILVRDELAQHEYGKENFTSVGPTVDGGGQSIDLSTILKIQPDNHFTERLQDTLKGATKHIYPSGLELYTGGENGAVLVFLGWRLRPVRREGLTLDEWFESRIKKRYTALEIEQEYPATLEEAIRPSIVKSYFDVDALEDMGYDGCAPIKQSEVDTYNGTVRVYKPPDKTRRYVVFTDPSDGVEDPFAMGVMDFITGEVVCSATGKEKVDFVASIHDYLVKVYNNATNSYEYNAVGMAFAKCLDNLQTLHQAPRRKTDGKIDEGKKGQFVSEKHKQLMFAELARATVKRQYIIHDREFLQQAKMVTRDDLGFPVTARKLSFDWVMMMNGLWQLQKYIPRGTFKVQTLMRSQDGSYYKG